MPSVVIVECGSSSWLAVQFWKSRKRNAGQTKIW